MRKSKILILEPDLAQRRLLAYLAEGLGTVSAVATLFEAMRTAQEWIPDVIVLAGDQALTLCRQLRGLGAFMDAPILLLLPASQKYEGFYYGATDVLTLPLDQLEFKLRLQVQLRRLQPPVEEIVHGALRLDPARHAVRLRGDRAELTPSEFAILSYLVAHPQAPVPTETLLSKALGEPSGVGNPQLVHTHIRNLRRKLSSLPGGGSLILSNRRGYQLALPE